MLRSEIGIERTFANATDPLSRQYCSANTTLIAATGDKQSTMSVCLSKSDIGIRNRIPISIATAASRMSRILIDEKTQLIELSAGRTIEVPMTAIATNGFATAHLSTIVMI